MGQRPNELTPDRSPLHRWGYELRELRKARGLSLRQLAEKALIDHSHLGRFERAEREADHGQAQRLDAALSAGGMLVRLWERLDIARDHVANPATHVAKPREHLAATSTGTAGSVDGDNVVVPCRTRDGRIRYVAVSRRALLLSGPVGLAAAALAPPLEAGAMPSSLPVGGPNPIEHFRAARRVLVQTDNLLGPRQAMLTVQQTLAALRPLRQDASGQDARDLLELQVRYAELAGWLAQDLGDVWAATTWTDRALQWALANGDPNLISYVLGRKSQLAADTGEGMDALDLAEAAQRGTKPRSRLQAIGEMHRAHGLALCGEEADALRTYDVALRLVSHLEDPGPWGSWLNAGYVHVQRARSLHVLGHHREAADGFRDAIGNLPTTYRRDRGVYLARTARVHASLGEPEQAATFGVEAVAIASETGSARIITELAQLDHQLAEQASIQQVGDFRAALDQIVHHEA